MPSNTVITKHGNTFCLHASNDVFIPLAFVDFRQLKHFKFHYCTKCAILHTKIGPGSM